MDAEKVAVAGVEEEEGEEGEAVEEEAVEGEVEGEEVGEEAEVAAEAHVAVQSRLLQEASSSVENQSLRLLMAAAAELLSP